MQKILVVLFTVCFFSHVFCDPITWSSPTTVSTSANNASNPQTTIDINGNTTAIWIENGAVLSATKVFGGNWNSPVVLATSQASSPQVLVDQNGNVTALWIENGFVKSSSKPIGGAWSQSTIVSLAGASAPQMAIGGSGNIVAVWVRDSVIESSTKVVGGSWSDVDLLSSAYGNAPDVAIGNGIVTAVWHGLVNSTYTIYAATKTIGKGTWSRPQVVSNSEINSVFPHVTIDPQGIAFAIWFRYDLSGSAFSNVFVQSSTRLVNGNWSIPVDISEAGIYNPAYLVSNIGCDPNGDVVAVWTTSTDGASFDIGSAIKPAGLNWFNPVTLDSQDLYAYSADLTINANAAVAYMSFDPSTSSVLIKNAQTDIDNITGGFYYDMGTISNPMTINGYPSIASSLKSNIVYLTATWVGNNGTNNVIQAATGRKIVNIPPKNVAVVQQSTNFNVFTEYFNVLSWQPSTDPNITGYNIFRNGQFINQVNQTTLQYIDHDQIQNGAVTYGISAVMTDQSQSATVFASLP